MTPLWITNIPILYEKKYLFEIIPLKGFDFNRKLNALVRLSVYYSLIVFILNRDNTEVFYIPLVVAILTYILSNKFKETSINQTNVELFNNKINEEENNEELVQALNDSCRIPTKNNPFMNPTIMDYGIENVKPACPSYNNKGIQKNIEKNFDEGLFRDVSDIFGKNNSQRQFYNVAQRGTIPDQGAFAQWLYGSLPTCKEGNGLQCAANQAGVPKGPGSDEIQGF
tara:strand:+ start:188 stop:865 length:678 start_codon:yes stop_codon:yes gene_type:complete